MEEFLVKRHSALGSLGTCSQIKVAVAVSPHPAIYSILGNAQFFGSFSLPDFFCEL
ncbi:hypothetical protein EVA_20739 [gut metagenome]|uniref:Uncharacterized protein n=1 Tax=gut metagenome TaxID=749906 RepID=J9FUY2_9ZZZZ